MLISHGAQEDCEALLVYSHSQTFGCSAVRTCVGALVHMKNYWDNSHIFSIQAKGTTESIIIYFYHYPISTYI